jgi:hypothetical protein
MVEIVQNAGGYVFGRKRAVSAPAPEVKEEHTPKPEVVIPKKEKKPKADKPKAEKKPVVKKKEKKEKEEVKNSLAPLEKGGS